jgi:hypothetical protein
MTHTNANAAGGDGGARQGISFNQQNDPVNTTAPKHDASPSSATQAPPLAVYAGRVCVGFIRPRGDTFEALDLDRRSLGLFSSRSAAADAIEETRR